MNGKSVLSIILGLAMVPTLTITVNAKEIYTAETRNEAELLRILEDAQQEAKNGKNKIDSCEYFVIRSEGLFTARATGIASLVIDANKQKNLKKKTIENSLKILVINSKIVKEAAEKTEIMANRAAEIKEDALIKADAQSADKINRMAYRIQVCAAVATAAKARLEKLTDRMEDVVRRVSFL